MIWPGMGDPYKRKKDNKISFNYCRNWSCNRIICSNDSKSNCIGEQPRSACINDIEKNWKISFTVELIVDGEKADIPAKYWF